MRVHLEPCLSLPEIGIGPRERRRASNQHGKGARKEGGKEGGKEGRKEGHAKNNWPLNASVRGQFSRGGRQG